MQAAGRGPLELRVQLLRLLVVKCSGFSMVRVTLPSRNNQIDPVFVTASRWLLISTRNSLPGRRDEKVNLADLAGVRGERGRLPGPVGLGRRHLPLDVLQGILLPGQPPSPGRAAP